MKNTILLFNNLLKAGGTKLTAFFLPALLATIASLGEGFTLVFLIPTIKGMIDLSYHPYLSLPAYLQDLLPVMKTMGRNKIILLCLLATFCAAFTKIAFAYFSNLLTTKQLKLFSARLRSKLFERYLSFGKHFFDQSNTGQLQQVITTYVNLISISLGTIQNSVYAVITMLIYFSMMIFISYKLTAIVILAFPILHYSLKKLVHKIHLTSNSYTDKYNELVKGISNSLSTISLVKAYSTEENECRKFSGLANEVSNLELNIERKTLLVGPVQDLVLLIFLFSLVALVALVFAGSSPLAMANYAVFFLILKRAATLFGVFSSISAAIASVSGPIAETAQILNDEGKYYISEGKTEFRGLKSEIILNNLSFTYPGGNEALKSINLKIKKGESLALIGESGSGKSTLIHLLMRFYDSQPGSILADGEDIRSFTTRSWLKHISLVSQDTLLFNATLEENLLYGIDREVTDEELALVLKKSRLEDFVMQLPKKLQTEIGDRGIKLSGGERQRLSIARAILKGSEILLLDEATSALDSRTEKLVQQAIDELMHAKTCITIAHRLSTIRNSTQVIVMEKGRIIEQGSFNELLRSQGAFAGYWQEQQL